MEHLTSTNTREKTSNHANPQRADSADACDRGDDQKAQQADQQLPDQVDPEQHGDLLKQVGIDPGEVLGGLGGKLGL
jgi:hypothetical protein